MNTRAKVRMLVLSIAAAALLGATVVLVAQQASPAVMSVAVCVKSNGQLRMLMGASTACATSEQRVDWVVGGEVTDITAGEGLTASRQGGAVQLAVNPTLLQKDRIFSGFNDGPAPIPFVFSGLATLDLPAGDFVILAKMTIINERSSGHEDRVLCRLEADADFDEAELVVPEHEEGANVVPPYSAGGLTMQLVHQFSVPGSVTLSCGGTSLLDLSYEDLKITAIEASSISNVFLGTP